MAQTRAFAIIGPSLWNQLLPSTRFTLLTGEPSVSFRSLKTALFPRAPLQLKENVHAVELFVCVSLSVSVYWTVCVFQCVYLSVCQSACICMCVCLSGSFLNRSIVTLI